MILMCLCATEISQKRPQKRQGIISNDRCTINSIKLRINAADKSAGNARDIAVANTYGNKFIIPLDFDMSDSSAPYHQAGLRNRLCYELKFNDYNQVINSTAAAPDATYEITDISLEHVT